MASWGDFTAFAKVAKSTLSAAQKKIDAVLDIQEGQEAGNRNSIVDDELPAKHETGEDVEPASTETPPAPFNKLQEDFFAAFGLSSASSTSTTQSPPSSSASKPKRGDGSSSKHPWKSIFGGFAAASSGAGEESETPDESHSSRHADRGETPSETEQSSAIGSVDVSVSQKEDPLFASSDTLSPAAADRQSADAVSTRLTDPLPPTCTEDEQKEEESSGWCTEMLVVPTGESDTTDLLLPADASPFFHSNAQLSFVGEDDQDGATVHSVETNVTARSNEDDQDGTTVHSVETNVTARSNEDDQDGATVHSVETNVTARSNEDDQDGTTVHSVETNVTARSNEDDTGLKVSTETDSVFVSSGTTPQSTELTTPSADVIPKTADLLTSAFPTSSFSISKESTSSCATNDTDYSTDSVVTVVPAGVGDNVPSGHSVVSESTRVEPPCSMSSSGGGGGGGGGVERNFSSTLLDSAVTSSTDSNERSVATILDGAEESQTDDAEGEEYGTAITHRGNDEATETSVAFETYAQDVTAETAVCLETAVLTRTASQLEISFDQAKESGYNEGDDKLISPGEDVIDAQKVDYEEEIIGDAGSLANVTDSFVRLSRSDSANEGGGADSNEGSGHSPTQPPTCGKSSEEASADELLDDGEGEAATTCSDIEVMSTPPYDTYSERSYRSGIVSRSAGDWSFHPPSKLFHVAKDNGVPRKHSHRRVGSDQSLASCDSVPASSCAIVSISRSASFTVQDYEKKIVHLTELVEARERKLLDIAKENAQLADENEQLRNELQQLHSRISRDSNVDAAQRELSERLNSIERRYDSVCKERDGLKRKCDNLEKEVASRVTLQQYKEKEDQIAELLAEGEKLSKQELKQGNIIKKLREKEKDSEKQLETMKSKLKDMDDLRQKLKQKDEQELKYDEMVHELKSTVSRQEKSMAKLRSDLEDARDKCTSYKTTLENCAKELAELNQDKAMKDAEIERLLAQAAESKENELQRKLDEAQLQWQTERQSLIREIQCVRLSSTQDVDECQRREQSLRWEISQLRQKLQETEERNQELAESITTATKPLLRQLDSMQLSFRTQQANWERVEKSLYERVGESEKIAATAAEKERESQVIVIEMRARLEQLEKQAAALSKEKSKLEASLLAAQREVENVERLKAKYTEDLQLEKGLHQQALEALNKDKELIGAQFEYEKRQLKSEYEKNIAGITETLNEKERLIVALRQQLASYQDTMQKPVASAPLSQQLALRISSESPPPGRGDQPSRASSTSFVQEDNLQTQYDVWPNDAAGGGYATVLEKLRSRLQQREGELSVVRDEMRSLQHNRDALALQLISLSNSNCELEQRLQELEIIRQQFKELDEKHQGLLLLYGEQIERNEELQLDLQDVKAMYKEQLDSLLQRPTS